MCVCACVCVCLCHSAAIDKLFILQIKGNAYTTEERCVAAGYDNGDLKLFDLRAMAVRWETNIGTGVGWVALSDYLDPRPLSLYLQIFLVFFFPRMFIFLLLSVLFLRASIYIYLCVCACVCVCVCVNRRLERPNKHHKHSRDFFSAPLRFAVYSLIARISI